MPNPLKQLSVILTLLGLSGCQPPLGEMSPVGISHRVIPMAVGQLEVLVEDTSGEDGSARWLDLPMTRQVEQWFQSRFQATSGQERGTLSLRKISLKEIPLPQEGGLKKLFATGDKERYEAAIDVRFEVRDALGFAEKFASASVCHSVGVANTISLAERQSILQKLINETLTHADEELQKSLNSFMPLMMVK